MIAHVIRARELAEFSLQDSNTLQGWNLNWWTVEWVQVHVRMLSNLVVTWPHQALQPCTLPAAYAGSGGKTACALCQRRLAVLEAAKKVPQPHCAERQAHAPPAITPRVSSHLLTYIAQSAHHHKAQGPQNVIDKVEGRS